MDYSDEFEKAVNYIKNSIKIDLDSDTKLYFYSYYKQATIGDCNIDRPTGLFNYTDKLKYDSWKNLSGVSQIESKRKYIEKLNEIINN